MKCVIPTEVRREIRGKGRVLECVPSLFPSYLPESSHLKSYTSKLTDTKHHINALLIRNGHYVIVATEDEKVGLNTYFIPEMYSDKYVVSYFKRNQGWSKKLLSRISHPLQYKNSRKDQAQRLYQWEVDTFKRNDSKITETQASKLIKHYMDAVSIHHYTQRFQYFHDLYALAKCCPIRHSGIVSSATEYLLVFSPERLTATTVLHEIAHAVDYERYRALNHGPSFMLVYNMLLKDYFGKSYLPAMKEAGLFKGKRNVRTN